MVIQAWEENGARRESIPEDGGATAVAWVMDGFRGLLVYYQTGLSVHLQYTDRSGIVNPWLPGPLPARRRARHPNPPPRGAAPRASAFFPPPRSSSTRKGSTRSASTR